MQMQEIFTVMDHPFMSQTTCVKYQKNLYESYYAAAERAMEEAGEEERRLALQRGDAATDCPYICIPVVADGTWLKRSYHAKFDSNSGIGVIIGYHTGKACITIEFSEIDSHKFKLLITFKRRIFASGV